MSYIKQSTARELIQKAFDTAKFKKDFQLKQQGGRCFIVVGKKSFASGMDWANAVNDLINQLTIMKARREHKKILITKDGNAHVLKQ